MILNPYELFVGLRFTRAKRRNRFISFISLISMLGIALGVTVLITVMSVMNGFETELRQRILSMSAHIMVMRYDPDMSQWQGAETLIKSNEQVVQMAPFLSGEGMITEGKEVGGVQIRGIFPAEEQKISDVYRHMSSGEFSDLQPGGLIIGSVLADVLKVKLHDQVTLITSRNNERNLGVLPNFNQFKIQGIFKVGMYEYDKRIVFLHIDDAKRLFTHHNGIAGLHIMLKDFKRAPQVAQELSAQLAADYFVTDWTKRHANFFKALAQQKLMMFIILSLIVAVAAFSIVTTLIMVVAEKQADIAILQTLGAAPASIMSIFVIQGIIIGVAGTAMGIGGGVLLAQYITVIIHFLESLLRMELLPPEVYYISDLSATLLPADILRVMLTALILSIVATLYPAWRAASTKPVESLRFE